MHAHEHETGLGLTKDQLWLNHQINMVQIEAFKEMIPIQYLIGKLSVGLVERMVTIGAVR